MDDAGRRIDAFVARLGLPEPDADADAMLDAIEERHGAAAVDRVLAAFAARTDRERYRGLYAEPDLAVEVTWRYAGAATRALLAAVERSGVLDGARRVIDLGSGEGIVPAYAAWSRPEAEVLATDLRPEAGRCVARLAERLGGLPGLRFERLSLRRVPARRRTRDWDAVLALRVLHELGPVAPALRLLAALVADGGAVAVAERVVGEPDLAARAREARAAGLVLDVAGARHVPVRELDAEGTFPLYVLRPARRR